MRSSAAPSRRRGDRRGREPRGVIDVHHRAVGYEGLLVCDGAAVPTNPGVNPSLTITAMAERAMTFVAPAPEVAPVAQPDSEHNARAV